MVHALLAGLGMLAGCDAKDGATETPSVATPAEVQRAPLPPMPLREPVQPDLATRQAENPTQLRNAGPSPQPFETGPNPEGIESVTYASEGRNLQAWLHRGEPGAPVLVYLHGGFAADAVEAYACPQFAEGGYSVLVPTYRGENGNPGSFELMFGEVRDAAAAVRYAQSLDGVDADRVVVFGHSVGAGIAALLAGMDDVPARMTGGAGGLYDPVSMEAFLVEFGVAEPVGVEVTLRSPSLMVEVMRTRHHAFVGSEDVGAHLGSTLAWLESKGAADHPLRLYDVPGDHFESLGPACAAFFELAEGRASPVAARSAASLDAAGRDPALELYQGESPWGQGPFGEPVGAASTAKPEHVMGWEISVPADATVEVTDAAGLRTMSFETPTFHGELSVGMFPESVQPQIRPLPLMFNALMSFEPTAARFFFPAADVVGVEVRGDSNGKRSYLRAAASPETLVRLQVWPADAPGVGAVVASLRPASD